MDVTQGLPTEASNAGEFARQLLEIIGPAYSGADGTNVGADFLALGGALDGAHKTLARALAQAFAGETTDLLADVEVEYGLPIRADLSTAQRQARLLAKLRAARGAQPQRILAAVAAIDATANLVENTPSTAPHELDTSTHAGAARGVYQFGVLVAIATFADPSKLATVRAVVEQMKGAHTRGSIGTRRAFRCTDPLSLTNRDLLE